MQKEKNGNKEFEDIIDRSFIPPIEGDGEGEFPSDNVVDDAVDDFGTLDSIEVEKISPGGGPKGELRRILILITIAVVAIILLWCVQKKNTINQMEKDAGEQRILQEQLQNSEENSPNSEELDTVNKLGSIVKEKINLVVYQDVDPMIDSVYRIYDMDENQTGYLVNLSEKQNEEQISLAVIFDNTGTMIQSVKDLDSKYDDANKLDKLNEFFEQFNNVKAPVVIGTKDDNTRKESIDMGVNIKDQPVSETEPTVIESMMGESMISEIVVKGVNTAYDFLKGSIVESQIKESAAQDLDKAKIFKFS